MPSFIDYNEQLLKYKDKALAAENGVFFDLTDVTPTEEQSKEGKELFSTIADYEEELTEDEPITPTPTEPPLTKKALINKRSEVAIDIPTVLHRTELNVSDENLSK